MAPCSPNYTLGSRLVLRNQSGATQKTNFIANVLLVRINWVHQSTAFRSECKTPSTSDSKKQKNDPTHCCSRITSEKTSKQVSNKIDCDDRLLHTGKRKGAYKNERKWFL